MVVLDFDLRRAQLHHRLGSRLASVTDALLLVRHADSAVVVVQHNKVDKKAVKRSVRRCARPARTSWGWC